jgi:ribonuclease HI
MPVINVFTDGGSRGNPGPAAAAYIVKKDNVVVGKGAKFLGVATNNIAEYSALILALTWLTENKSKINNLQINFFLDSLLVVNQINGIYKVKNAKPFYPL